MIERDWITEAGLRAICYVSVRRDGKRSHRCGYVAVPKGHVLHGCGYSDPSTSIPYESAESSKCGKKNPILLLTVSSGAFSGEKIRRSPDVVFDVHGGLTFSGDHHPVSGDDWWFGFDCLHFDDAAISENPSYRDGVVRSEEYVVNECESLARQIVEMFGRVVPE